MGLTFCFLNMLGNRQHPWWVVVFAGENLMMTLKLNLEEG